MADGKKRSPGASLAAWRNRKNRCVHHLRRDRLARRNLRFSSHSASMFHQAGGNESSGRKNRNTVSCFQLNCRFPVWNQIARNGLSSNWEWKKNSPCQTGLPNRVQGSSRRWGTKVFDRTETLRQAIVSVTSVECPHGVRRQARTSCCLTEASVLRNLRDVL